MNRTTDFAALESARIFFRPTVCSPKLKTKLAALFLEGEKAAFKKIS